MGSSYTGNHPFRRSPMPIPRTTSAKSASQVDRRSTANQKRKVAPERMRALKVDGNVARHHYLVRALRHIAVVKTARAHSVAFKLYPARQRKAAFAAAQRVLAHGVARGYLAYQEHPTTQRRYYALTRAGALWLHEQQPELGPVRRSDEYLTPAMSKSEHREWTSMLAFSSNLRVGLIGMDEFELHGPAGEEVRLRFNHVPDALTIWKEAQAVIWHEVETSRRSKWSPAQRKREEASAWNVASRRARELNSKGRKKANGQAYKAEDIYSTPLSDTDRFESLVKQIRQLRYLPWAFDGDSKKTELDIALVLHCKTALIQRERAQHLRTMFGTSLFVNEKVKDSHFLLSYEHKSPRGNLLHVYLTLIPANADEVWHDTGHLPFPNAPQKQRQDLLDESEMFMATTRAPHSQ